MALLEYGVERGAEWLSDEMSHSTGPNAPDEPAQTVEHETPDATVSDASRQADAGPDHPPAADPAQSADQTQSVDPLQSIDPSQGVGPGQQ
jgi:hypothetical protein